MSEAPSVFIHCVFFRETLDPKLVEAASAAASTLPDRSQAESELLRQLMAARDITEAQKKGDVNNLGYVSNKGMLMGWIFNETVMFLSADALSPSCDIAKALVFNFIRTSAHNATVIFSARPTLWDMDFANQLSLSTNQTPRNGLEEMIQWTKEGKMWQYPVNNEKHLEEGFARQGPVRHFMELVVAGLEHISWFRDYFHQKEEVPQGVTQIHEKDSWIQLPNLSQK
uniref:Small ribosomal subunit protein mS31 n=1 Tax=Cyclopterus lumpus TaxID=8103 RepID=A0A8C2WXT3_CYCLU